MRGAQPQLRHKWPKISVTLCLHLYFPKRYSFIAFSLITIRARSSALSRVISPSFIMPVSANASASRPVAAFAYPLSSHPIAAVPGAKAVPNRTFSGYHSSQLRIAVLSVRVESSASASEHRFFPLLKRFADGRSSILLPDDFASWRGPRGYVENVAHAIALAATSEQAAGRIYNICEEPSLSELEWQTRITKQMNWPGKFVVLPRER